MLSALLVALAVRGAPVRRPSSGTMVESDPDARGAADAPTPSGPPRYLMTSVDEDLEFADAMRTYLGGVALASRHGMRLLHLPFKAARLGHAFDLNQVFLLHGYDALWGRSGRRRP